MRLFPSWHSLLDDRPVISVDHAIHLYHGYLGARFLKEHGTSWGYDPFFMAGYPKTPVYDSSSGPAELFELAAGARYSPGSYKCGLALLVWLAPLLVAAAARSYGSGPFAAAATLAWVIWYWWVGFPSVLVRSGLVAFLWAAALAVLVPGLMVRLGRRLHATTWLALTAVAALGVQAHPTFVLMVCAPALVAWTILPAARSWRWHLALGAAGLAALTVTCFWWYPLLKFLPIKTASTIFLKAEYWGFIWDYYAGFADARIPILQVIFGALGLLSWWRDGKRPAALVLTTQLVVLSLLTFAGSMWQVTRNLEPLRFQVPLALAWSVPAGAGICAVCTGLDPRHLAGPIFYRLRWLAATSVVLLTVALSTPQTWWWRPVDQRPPSSWKLSAARIRSARPLAVGLRPEMERLVAWIREHTDTSARILLEDQLRLWEPTEEESLHWTPLLPLLTGRQFVGGLYHLAFIRHHQVAFGDWHLAGRHIHGWTPSELQAFCRRYNIGWVITWSRASPRKEGGSPLSTEVFASLPFCEQVATLPRLTRRPEENRYTVFRVRTEQSYFSRGRGRVVRVDYNRIELAELHPENDELVLKYHWQDGLRADPAVAIERAEEPGDPIGFIRIRTARPLPRLTLINAYQ